MKTLTPNKRQLRQWSCFLIINLTIASYLGYAFHAPASTIKASLLPGETTHGHYQIELDCNACHSPTANGKTHSSENVMQDACVRCHGEQLKRSRDTHPASKFNDPTSAELLLTLDAQNCLTCHREHVPHRTSEMGLTIPKDYCWHCHQEIAESRPSHRGMAYDSCATAGCHNYHDNRALYENFLDQHHGEPDGIDDGAVPKRNGMSRWLADHAKPLALTTADSDAPSEIAKASAETITRQWAETAHARAGVNCSGCHHPESESAWSDRVSMKTCGACHPQQSDSFQSGRHGMRMAQEMTPLTPKMARQPMHLDAAHREMTCNTCHPGHRFDTQFAAAEACQQCHADAHSVAYSDSKHAELWSRELQGDLPPGAGVSCATCHLPRLRDGSIVWVNHDQNANLRPNETMAREVCGHCHGLEFSLSSLADPEAVRQCFDAAPDRRTKSVEMAHAWFEQKAKARERRRRNPPK